MNHPLKVVSLFAGIGGFDLGFEQAGFRVTDQVEIDDFCQRVLEWHFPDTMRFKDVRDVGRQNLSACDVLVGGFPCQDLSVAGKRTGLAGKRSGLFWEVVRIAGEITPKWLCLENVPGLLSSQGGRDHQTVIDALVQLGYGVAWRVLDAQYFGVAQRRRRVFLVGCLGDAASAAKVLFESESCSGDTPPSRGKGARAAATITRGAATADRRQEDDFNIVSTGYTADVCGALTNASGKRGWKVSAENAADGQLVVVRSLTAPHSQRYDATVENFAGVRRLTPTECARLQGFPDDWCRVDGDKTPDSPQYRAYGNAVCVNVSRWIAKRIMTLYQGGPT